MTTKLSICLIAPFPPIKGGIAQHSARLGQALQELGHTVDVVSWYRQYPSSLYPGEQVAPRRDQRHMLSWRNPRSWVRARGRVRQAVLVVFPWVSPFNAWVLAFLVAGIRSRTIAVVHNALPHDPQPLAKPLTRLFLTRLNHYVVHSRSVGNQLEDLLGSLDIRYVAHPPNLDIAPSPLPPTPPLRLLFLGYIRRYKGVDVLLRAISVLMSRGVDVRALVAGEAWGLQDELGTLARELGIENSVEFRFSYVDDAEVVDLLAGHHLVVQPYREASQSGVIPLAMAARRPVVVTRVGGLEEQVEEVSAVPSPSLMTRFPWPTQSSAEPGP